MTKIKNVINTLLHLQTQINFQVEILNKVFDNDEILNQIKSEENNINRTTFRDSLNAIISNSTIIPFCSFLDEYNRFFTPSYVEPEFAERVKKVKIKNKEGVKRINQWNGLTSFRNHLVAHSFRIKGTSFFSEKIEILEYKIPNTNSEKNLFNGIIYIMCSNIRQEFPDVINQIDPNFIMLDKLKIKGQKIDSDKELYELFLKMK